MDKPLSNFAKLVCVGAGGLALLPEFKGSWVPLFSYSLRRLLPLGPGLSPRRPRV